MVLTYKKEFYNVQNTSSVELDQKAWSKPVWSSRSKKQLKWPNLPSHTDIIYDAKPDLAESARTSPVRYRGSMASDDHRFASNFSLQTGDARFKYNLPACMESLGPGTYTAAYPSSPTRISDSHPGTYAFTAVERPSNEAEASPDTSNGPLMADKKAWGRKAFSIPTAARAVDVGLWRHPQQSRVMRDQKIRDVPFYDVPCTNNGQCSSMFGQVCASPKKLMSSFASGSKRLSDLPNSRTSDRRAIHGLSIKEKSSVKPVNSRIWDGKEWVEPSQYMRRQAAHSTKTPSPAQESTTHRSMKLGKLKQTVSADGLYLFTEMRRDLQGSAALRAQGHFTKSTFNLDSSLTRRR